MKHLVLQIKGKIVAADIIQKINLELNDQGIDLSLNVNNITGKSTFVSTSSSKTINFNLDNSFNCDNSNNKIFKSYINKITKI